MTAVRHLDVLTWLHEARCGERAVAVVRDNGGERRWGVGGTRRTH